MLKACMKLYSKSSCKGPFKRFQHLPNIRLTFVEFWSNVETVYTGLYMMI